MLLCGYEKTLGWAACRHGRHSAVRSSCSSSSRCIRLLPRCRRPLLRCSSSAWDGFQTSNSYGAYGAYGGTGRFEDSPPFSPPASPYQPAASNNTEQQQQQVWQQGGSSFADGSAAGQSPASSWEDAGSGSSSRNSSGGAVSASGWSAPPSASSSPDWGDTFNPGDWGEIGRIGADNAPYPQQFGQEQQQQQQAAYSATNSSSSSSAPYGAVPPQSSFAAGAGAEAAGFAGSSSSSHAGTWSPGAASANADRSYSSEEQQQQQEAYDSWPFADATQQRQQPAGFAAGGSSSAGGGARPPILPSDITLLGRRDADSMLPLAPSPDQARFYQPRTVSERLVQVLGSFGLSMVLSKSAVLAGPALLYPIWGPWIRAGLRNMQLYLRQFTCVGLWRSEVLGVQLNTVPHAYRDMGTAGDTVTITVGDPWQGGACTQLTFPYQSGCEDIVEGEPAELLVLSQDDTFFNFKVVREVYLPQSGMWLSEYPFVDRDVFLDVSLAIERGRQAAVAAAASGSSGTAAAAGPYSSMPGVPEPQQGFSPAAAGFNSTGFEAAGAGFNPAGSSASASSGFSNGSGFNPAEAYGGFGSFTSAATAPWSYPSVSGPAAAAADAAGLWYTVEGGVNAPAGSSRTAADAVEGVHAAQHEQQATAADRVGSLSDWMTPQSNPSSNSSSNNNGIGSTSSNAVDSNSNGTSHAAVEQQPSSSSANNRADSSASSSSSTTGVGSTSSNAFYDNVATVVEAPAPDHNTSSNSSSSGYYNTSYSVGSNGTGQSSLLTNPAAVAAGLVDEVAGVASGVAAGVAAGLTGWFTGAANEQPGSSGADTAVLPDAIIEGPGVQWAPAVAGSSGSRGSYSYYGSSSSSFIDARPWTQQQQQQQQQWYSAGEQLNGGAAAYQGRWEAGSFMGYNPGGASAGFSGWTGSDSSFNSSYDASNGFQQQQSSDSFAFNAAAGNGYGRGAASSVGGSPSESASSGAWSGGVYQTDAAGSFAGSAAHPSPNSFAGSS